jgi:DNA-binding HxlR family transcriptional regulator
MVQILKEIFRKGIKQYRFGSLRKGIKRNKQAYLTETFRQNE